MRKQGWLRRQLQNATDTVRSLPAWMREDQKPMKYFIQELEHMANCETGEDETRIMAEVSDIKDAFQICGALNYYKNEWAYTEYFVVDAEGNEVARPLKPVYTPPEGDDIPF